MLDKWGRFTHRNRWRILISSLVAIIGAAIYGPGVFNAVDSAGGFYVTGSDSDRAARVLEEDSQGPRVDILVLYTGEDSTVDDEAYQQAVHESLAALPQDAVAGYATYWALHEQAGTSPAAGEGAADPFADLVSEDRGSTFAMVELVGDDEQARDDSFAEIKDQLGEADGLTAQVGGPTATEAAIGEQTGKDIALAEMLSMPLLLLLMLVIFGTLNAALLPLVIAGMATLISFAALRVLTNFTDVSIFAITITTILSLILAVDYGLFMVSRYREELAAGRRGEDALAAVMVTAGRTVMVSGLIVVMSLATMMLFPLMFLRSMAYGGVATVLVALVGAVVVLPALLAVFGTRINSLKVLRSRDLSAAPKENSGWSRVAHSVMRRPVLYALGALTLLAALATPVLSLSPGGVDERVLPSGMETRQVSEQVQQDFPPNTMTPIDVVVTGASEGEAAEYAERLAAVEGVDGYQLVPAGADTVHITLAYELDWQSSEARGLVGDLRAVDAPAGAEALVGGSSAELVDQIDGITSTLPLAVLVLGVAILILLFLSFGSVLVPLKAIVMNLLSVAAAFGVLVWIFQDGNLSGLLGFTPTGTIDPATLILIVALLFGLSMDYEVFLLSRIREQYDKSGDNTAAVAEGLRRTGGIITAAAALLLIVVGAFSFSGVTIIKMIGIGMLVAIVADVVVIRLLLVPATMKLMGRANWWAPGPLARIYRRAGIHETSDPASDPAAGASGGGDGEVPVLAGGTPGPGEPAGRP